MKRPKAGPIIVFRRTNQTSLHRVGMNVVDLLPNHPAAPQGQSLRTFLPDLMAVLIDVKEKPLACFDNAFRRKTLKFTDKFFDAAIADWQSDGNDPALGRKRLFCLATCHSLSAALQGTQRNKKAR